MLSRASVDIVRGRSVDADGVADAAAVYVRDAKNLAGPTEAARMFADAVRVIREHGGPKCPDSSHGASEMAGRVGAAFGLGAMAGAMLGVPLDAGDGCLQCPPGEPRDLDI